MSDLLVIRFLLFLPTKAPLKNLIWFHPVAVAQQHTFPFETMNQYVHIVYKQQLRLLLFMKALLLLIIYSLVQSPPDRYKQQ